MTEDSGEHSEPNPLPLRRGKQRYHLDGSLADGGQAEFSHVSIMLERSKVGYKMILTAKDNENQMIAGDIGDTPRDTTRFSSGCGQYTARDTHVLHEERGGGSSIQSRSVTSGKSPAGEIM